MRKHTHHTGTSVGISALTWACSAAGRRAINNTAYKILVGAIAAVILVDVPFAATVTGLYVGEVKVASRGSDDRNRAVRSAMRAVLTKLTGNRNVAGGGRVDDLINNAARYQQSYQYFQATFNPLLRTAEDDLGLRLRVTFDQRAVDESLRRNGLPVWAKERPATLVWIIVNKPSGSSVVGTDDTTGYAQTLRTRAFLRGLPVILPLLDLEEVSQLQSGEAGLLAASGRYDSDAIAVVTVGPAQAEGWEGSWRLQLGAGQESWSTSGAGPVAVLSRGIDHLADSLAARYLRAADGQAESAVEVTVAGIGNVDQYAQVQKYLQGLDVVTRVNVTLVEPGAVTFLVYAHGGAAAVSQSAELGDRLVIVSELDGLQFRLLP